MNFDARSLASCETAAALSLGAVEVAVPVSTFATHCWLLMCPVGFWRLDVPNFADLCYSLGPDAGSGADRTYPNLARRLYYSRKIFDF